MGAIKIPTKRALGALENGQTGKGPSKVGPKGEILGGARKAP